MSGAVVECRDLSLGFPRRADLGRELRRLVEDFGTYRLHCDVLELPNLTGEQREQVHKMARRYALVSKSKGKGKDRTLMLCQEGSRVGLAYVKPSDVSAGSDSAAPSNISTIVPIGDRGGFRDLPSCSQPLEDEFGFHLSDAHVNTIANFLHHHPLGREDQALLDHVSLRPQVSRNNYERLPRYERLVPPAPQKAVSTSLPAFPMRPKLLAAIRESRVTLVTGETGCGKTTQVPQYLLEEARGSGEGVSMVVTQPRRLPATSVAKRVAAERGEKLGTTVGYHIRFDKNVSSQTCLTFCTSGVLLKTLTDGDSALANLTHIILDEVHEREQFTDFLLTHLRLSLARFPHLKLILMSATMSEHIRLFQQYFGGATVCHIPCRTYNVAEVYLEDILLRTNYDDSLVREASARAEEELRTQEDTGHVGMEEEVWDTSHPPVLPGGMAQPQRPRPIVGAPSEVGLGRITSSFTLLPFTAD